MALFDFLRGNGGSDGSSSGTARSTTVAKPSMPRVGSGPYAAVELFTGKTCCTAAAALPSGRMLASQAPSLPLAGCTSPAGCYCRYKKYPDRRSGGDRRLEIKGEVNRWFHGSERREDRSRGRRWND